MADQKYPYSSSNMVGNMTTRSNLVNKTLAKNVVNKMADQAHILAVNMEAEARAATRSTDKSDIFNSTMQYTGEFKV